MFQCCQCREKVFLHRVGLAFWYMFLDVWVHVDYCAVVDCPDFVAFRLSPDSAADYFFRGAIAYLCRLCEGVRPRAEAFRCVRKVLFHIALMTTSTVSQHVVAICNKFLIFVKS